jgi:hypothetical protein
MKACGGVKVEFHAFFFSAVVGDKWLLCNPGRFVPGKVPLSPMGIDWKT